MKTALHLIAAFVLAAFNLSTAVVQAQLTYVTNNGTITITGYTGPGGDVTVPGTIDGLPVTSIGEQAFYWCTNLISISIPDGVTTIGDWAFCACDGLTNATIPNSVTSIGGGAFAHCYSLSSLTIPNSVTSIGAWAFYGCTGLTSVTLGGGVTNVARSAFRNCTSLASLKMSLNLDGLPGFDFIEGFTSIRSLDVSSMQAGAMRVPTTLAGLRELRIASATLQSLGVPYQLGGLTNLDLRDMSGLGLLVIPESLVTSLSPPIETLRNQGVVVSTYDLLHSPLHYVSLACTNPLPPYTTWATAANVIQDAVDAAKSGDTVLVTNGVYAVGGKRTVTGWLYDSPVEPFGRVVVTNAIRLESVNGPSLTIIDGGWNGETRIEDGSGVRCVYLGSHAVLSGLTLTNGWGWGQSGGGVFSEPTGVVTNCIITGNSAIRLLGGVGSEAGPGGGAYGGTLNNCMVVGNTSLLGGGAGSATLNGCSLIRNAALSGSARCSGGFGGGAIGCTLNNCTLTGNTAEGWCDRGGGAAESTLYNCTLTGNSGGGADGSTLYNCTVTGNTGESDGLFYNCTVADNDGGIRGTAFNSIVYYNSGGNYGEGTLLNYCLTSPLPTNGVGNITGPPLFMDLAAGDFQLREDSPCIDAGTNLLGMTWTRWTWTYDPDTGEPIMLVGHITDPTDILGNTRFIDGNFDGIVAWDIGAYEFNSFKPPRFAVSPQLTADGWKLNVTGEPNKWVHLQRSGNLKDWEDIWSGRIGPDGTQQCPDSDMGQQAMFYRVVVP